MNTLCCYNILSACLRRTMCKTETHHPRQQLDRYSLAMFLCSNAIYNGVLHIHPTLSLTMRRAEHPFLYLFNWAHPTLLLLYENLYSALTSKNV